MKEWLLESAPEKFVFQKEAGERGTPHYQGVINWKRQREIRALAKRYPGIHWEVMRGTWDQAQKYCEDPSKTVLEPPVYYGCGVVRGPPVYRMRLAVEQRLPWQRQFWEMCQGPAHPRKIYWYWETQGNVGKTSIAHDLIVDMKRSERVALLVSGKAADIKSAIAACMAPKGKEEPREPSVLIWDLPRVRQGYIDYAGLEEVKNGVFFNGKYESGMVLMQNTPHVIVFANFAPELDKLSADRWEVVDLNPPFEAGSRRLSEGSWEDA